MARAKMTAEQIAAATLQWRDSKGRQKVVMAWVQQWVEGGAGSLVSEDDDPRVPQPVSQRIVDDMRAAGLA